MTQLTVKTLMEKLFYIKDKLNLSKEEFESLQVYLGDDDELNGIHGAWCCYDIYDDSSDGDMIRDCGGCPDMEKDKAILIS